MAYNDNDFRHYPNFIARDCATNRASYTIKLSEPIRNELDEIFDAKYGKGNKQHGLHDMVMEYLNTKCLQRKAYNFEYHILLRKNHDIKITDLMPVGFTDFYKFTEKLEYEINMKDKPVLMQPSDLQPVYISKYVDNLHDFLTDDNINSMKSFDFFNPNSNITHDEFLKKIDEWKTDNNIDDLYELSFFLNNYLDFKLDGQYVGEPFGHVVIHKGIGEFKDIDNQSYFFTYTWSHYPVEELSNQVTLSDFKLIDYGEFMELCSNSDNPMLHRYVGVNTLARKLDDDSVTIDAEIKHAKDKIKKWQETLQELEKIKSENND